MYIDMHAAMDVYAQAYTMEGSLHENIVEGLTNFHANNFCAYASNIILKCWVENHSHTMVRHLKGLKHSEYSTLFLCRVA